MKTNIQHDPDLPYAVVTKGVHGLNSRFKYENEAINHVGSAAYLEVIDTAPKPKIPEDAEFIMWWAPETQRFAWRVPLGWKYWEVSASLLGDLKTLESEIEDAEVTVLVRKEDA